MSPRALNEQEKCQQCEKLVKVGKSLIMRYGLSKTSVDDIVQGAGVAKGSFYKHFETKEQFLSRVVWQIYQDYIKQAEQFIQNSDKNNLSQNIKSFIIQLFSMPETFFFFCSEQEISQLFQKLPKEEMLDYTAMEKQAFKHIVELMGANLEQVNPDVVHNYMHTLFMMNSSNLMVKDALQDTFSLMLNSLIEYVFGGRNEQSL